MSSRLALLDRTGVFASVFCAVHCAVAPLLLLALPTFGGLWSHPLAHLAIAALVLPIAGFALRHGFRAHGTRWILALGCLGIGLVLVGAVLPYLTGGGADGGVAGGDPSCDQCCPSFVVDEITGDRVLHVPPATIVTLIGGISLVVAHIANLRGCAACGAVNPIDEPIP